MDFLNRQYGTGVKQSERSSVMNRLIPVAQPMSALTQAMLCFLGWAVGPWVCVQVYIPNTFIYLYILLHLQPSPRISSKEHSIALWNTKSLLLWAPGIYHPLFLKQPQWPAVSYAQTSVRPGVHTYVLQQQGGNRPTNPLAVAQHDQACIMGPKQTVESS